MQAPLATARLRLQSQLGASLLARVTALAVAVTVTCTWHARGKIAHKRLVCAQHRLRPSTAGPQAFGHSRLCIKRAFQECQPGGAPRAPSNKSSRLCPSTPERMPYSCSHAHPLVRSDHDTCVLSYQSPSSLITHSSAGEGRYCSCASLHPESSCCMRAHLRVSFGASGQACHSSPGEQSRAGIWF